MVRHGAAGPSEAPLSRKSVSRMIVPAWTVPAWAAPAWAAPAWALPAWAVLARSALHGEHGLHDQAEAAQHAQQLAVAEPLAAGREAGPPGRLLEQRVCGVGLQGAGLLVVAVAVQHAVRAAERPGRVDRFQRGVDPRILPRRHLVHHRGGLLGQGGVLVGVGQVLDLLQRARDDLRDAHHERAVEHAAEDLDARNLRAPA